MSPDMKESITKIAERVARDPMRASIDDVRKLARAWLLQVTGRIPRVG